MSVPSQDSSQSFYEDSRVESWWGGEACFAQALENSILEKTHLPVSTQNRQHISSNFFQNFLLQEDLQSNSEKDSEPGGRDREEDKKPENVNLSFQIRARQFEGGVSPILSLPCSLFSSSLKIKFWKDHVSQSKSTIRALKFL